MTGQNTNIALIGLGVMGKNIARNIANNGFSIVVYNRTGEVTTEFIGEFGLDNLIGSSSVEEMINTLERPRKIMIMVKDGIAVDKVIDSLMDYLDEGDIIVDLGNSYFKDTIRRNEYLSEKGIRFVGCGVSGGEEGALNGPSIMPGGDVESWEELKPIFEAISAKDFSEGPCVSHIGKDGAGHYVKMVHNGIEYGVMQIIAEAYEMLKVMYNLKPQELADVFEKLNEGKLNSYLFEITVDVLSRQDEIEDGFLIDYILDKAGNKGTGKWTSQDALDRGVSLPTITESVYARYVSAEKDLRKDLSELYKDAKVQKVTKVEMPLEKFIEILDDALYAAILSCYAQGYHLINVASDEYGWDVDFEEISRIWQGGCIIRAKTLVILENAYKNSDELDIHHLFQIPEIAQEIKDALPNFRELISLSFLVDVSTPAISSAYVYFDSMTQERLSANLIQGLRDRFGSHTYERTDREGSFHTQWS